MGIDTVDFEKNTYLLRAPPNMRIHIIFSISHSRYNIMILFLYLLEEEIRKKIFI